MLRNSFVSCEYIQFVTVCRRQGVSIFPVLQVALVLSESQ